MRLSKFQTKTIWFIGLTALVILAFYFDLKDDNWIKPHILFFRINSVLFLFIWSIGLSETLPEIAVLKYKIIEEEWSVEAKYLTFWCILIPYWKSIDVDYHSYEVQNLFGATWDSCYTTDVTYKNKSEAISAIEKHKAKIKRNRKDWFEIPKPEVKKVSYM